ncbi:MAG: hypothetical protein CMK44_05040 [Porticoccus sp.]|mgnify:CR=1 FL=1|jgi:uncharacterized membrane protein YfcA|nr:hypothetical protein [Porticoccus sp.]|tara:strand:+ start:257 stop:1048 length:792 start_codon:yes stop_codon:yes gene_type:complete
MPLEFILYAASGAFVGLIIGMTGVGGGSLMTPLLILFGVPYNVAIGTDLLYASITKSSGVFAHAKQKSINWILVGWLAAGSIPAAIVTVIFLDLVFTNADEYQSLLTTTLGVMLVLTALVILFNRYLRDIAGETFVTQNLSFDKNKKYITFFLGIVLGVFVTLSSVGAGAFCAALLLMLYPKLTPLHIIGTDIAHAVPLTLIAGLSHLFLLGNVDLVLLISLLFGSLPAIHLGAKLAARIPSEILQPFLAVILLGIGLKFIVF